MDVDTLGGRSGASNLLGMPETSFRGLSTRTARSVRRSTWVLKCVPAVARMLWAHRDRAQLSQGKPWATSVPHSHTRLGENHVPGQVQGLNSSQRSPSLV